MLTNEQIGHAGPIVGLERIESVFGGEFDEELSPVRFVPPISSWIFFKRMLFMGRPCE